MPYIPQDKRKELNNYMQKILDYIQKSENDIQIGEMNYIISNLINTYIEKTKNNNTFNYNVCNNLIGLLECSKLELYRMVISEYEDQKIKQNGNLYNK
jgi:regulator of sigma D